MNTKFSSFPKELKSLVNIFVKNLGDVIREEGGLKVYNSVEKIRKNMVLYRKATNIQKEELLNKMYKSLKVKSAKEQSQIAHSYTLMLETINACEAAYRTYRLQENKSINDLPRYDSTLVYVLTAHPTEARTPANIELFHRIQSIALRILQKSGEESYLISIVKHNFKVAWLLPITRHKKPEVADEANHLFSIILRPDIFDVLLRANRDIGTVRVRTWVGGDKDGHPGVDDKVMIQCLQASRNHFISITTKFLNDVQKDLRHLDIGSLNIQVGYLFNLLREVKKLKSNDSLRVRTFKKELRKLEKEYFEKIGGRNPRLLKLLSIVDLFPGLVIPIEVREDSEIIANALNAPIEKDFAITKMLKALKDLSGDGKVSCYAQGMIISMCESSQDILNTHKLMNNVFGYPAIRIIPLFETATALENSSKIVTEILSIKKLSNIVTDKWHNKFEVMLGYSDSSKGMGVLASRLGIAKTMRSLDVLIKKYKHIPVFFHGSGGSVDRGGGSLENQTAWWPKSALQIYKATIQGEMVERNFSTSEVTLSGMNKILSNLKKTEYKKGHIKIDSEVERFADMVSSSYKDKISKPSFFHMVEKATPYSYLNVLKLGSRPAKRAKAKVLDFSSIRAIPWVLCWTQTRVLFPTWWGVGQAYAKYKKDKKSLNALKKSLKTSFLFSSFIRVLGFTLSKVDLQIFKLYLSKSTLSESEKELFFKEFEKEYTLACQFVRFMSGEKNLLWFRPWLSESINLRSSMIHPLNALQIIAKESNNEHLIRKTTAGISSGMMTTG